MIQRVLKSPRGGCQATKLNSERLERCFLFFPSVTGRDGERALTDEVPPLFAQQGPENVHEKSGDTLRTKFGAHMCSSVYAKLVRL